MSSSEPIRPGHTFHINERGFEADATVLDVWMSTTGIAAWRVRYDNGNEQVLYVSGDKAERTRAGLVPHPPYRP